MDDSDWHSPILSGYSSSPSPTMAGASNSRMAGGCEDETTRKRQVRLLKNREAAKECRRKKKVCMRHFCIIQVLLLDFFFFISQVSNLNMRLQTYGLRMQIISYMSRNKPISGIREMPGESRGSVGESEQSADRRAKDA